MKALQESLRRLELTAVVLISTTCLLADGNATSSELQKEEAPAVDKPALKYISGYKYHLHEDYEHSLSFDTGVRRTLGFIELNGDRLVLRKGYGWDGASGPVFDTKNVMRATAVHDALYRLIRYELLSETEFKDRSDLEFVQILEEDGVPKLGRYWFYQAVKQFGLKGVREIGMKKVRTTADLSDEQGTDTKLASALEKGEERS